MTDHTDEELEGLLREGLSRLAEGAQVRVPLGERARRGVVRRRRRRLLGAGALVAAVAVVAAVTVTALSRGHQEVPAPTTATGGDAGLRPEYWHGVMVQVPAGWGWGTTCGASLRSDGSRLTSADPTVAYVGRPVAPARGCEAVSREPRAPYVWFDAGLPVGTQDLGGGWTRRTVEVGGVTVTVATRDAASGTRIIASARRQSSPCAASLDSPPSVGASAEDGVFVPTAMTVCAYAADDAMTSYDLLYEQTLEMGPAKYLVSAVAKAPAAGEFSCYAAQGGEWARLHLTGDGGSYRDYVVDLSCPSIAAPDGVQHVLTRADVAPWSVDGVRAVLHGNNRPALADLIQ